MTRCGCASTSCSCAINAGSGIGVSGTGSESNPYVVSVLSEDITIGATGARPSAATVGPGSTYYDTTLSKPIWSDGTVWRDAAGTAV